MVSTDRKQNKHLDNVKATFLSICMPRLNSSPCVNRGRVERKLRRRRNLTSVSNVCEAAHMVQRRCVCR